MKIAVIGLGKLGSCHAAVMSYKGFEVIGADINQKFVDDINAGIAPVQEPRLQELIDASKSRLRATTDVAKAVSEADVTFVIVPTPSDENGIFSMKYALKAAEAIGAGLKENKKDYPVVVMTSTVMPGDTEAQFVPVLEKFSGKKMLKDFGACYSPEFIALGSVVRDMLMPDMILIGESDKKAGDKIQAIYENSCEAKPYFARMNFVNAEITKISVNTYVTTKISYANMLMQVCSKIKGADIDVVSNAIGQDSRIGVKYLKGGLAFGGPCFPRDNIAFGKLAKKVGIDAIMSNATDEMNSSHTKFIANLIESNLDGKKNVAILGLSYKPNTPVIDVSPGIALARELLKKGLKVCAYDPMAIENSKAVLPNIDYKNNTQECLKNADLVIIATPWQEFINISPQDIKDNVLVVDCWRVLNKEKWAGKTNLIRIGAGL